MDVGLRTATAADSESREDRKGVVVLGFAGIYTQRTGADGPSGESSDITPSKTGVVDRVSHKEC